MEFELKNTKTKEKVDVTTDMYALCDTLKSLTEAINTLTNEVKRRAWH